MIDYNKISPRTHIVLDGQPYEVLDSHIFRKQMRKPVNQTKLKNLITGKVVERTFQQSDKAEEADLSSKKVVFIYSRQNECWFHTSGNRSERFSVSEDVIGNKKQFLKEGSETEALIFDEKIIAFRIPIKVDLEVAEAPPATKGNTAQGGDKRVILETGASVTTPLFINVGDIVRVNTETGEYVERVEKN